MKPKRDSKPPIRRRDAAGHIATTYAKELLALSGRSDGDEQGRAFLERPDDDELAEAFGEAFLEGATSGQEADVERLDEMVAFQGGGPFVLTSARREFACGVDDSNPCGATKEPFPRAVGGEDTL
jgi:hypothetical protein